MSDTKLLQAILEKVLSLDKKVDSLDKKMDHGFKTVNKRIDTLGLQLAQLEDDAPTREEFNALDHRVAKLEGKIHKN